MAALKTSGQAGQRAADEGLDRSLQHMLRAIVEERHRLALGHDIGGLGENKGSHVKLASGVNCCSVTSTLA
uniref:Uncharacterized protein n=1 Tax=Sphaerodactylus townsendi TaxID=933632 RepID=A0ACB8EB22_9SAUR